MPTAPDPLPTEDGLRDELAGRCPRNFADDNVRRAREVHERSKCHLADCEARLRSFDGLDEEIGAATVAQLADEHRSRIELPDALRFKQSARSLAQDDLRAATQAERTLAAALEEAQREAASASQKARIAVVRLTHLRAEELAIEALTLEARATVLRELVLAADSVAVKPGPAMRHLAADGQRYLRPVDRSGWQRAREALLADPDTSIDIPLPELPPLMLQRGSFSGAIVKAVPLPEPVEEEIE